MYPDLFSIGPLTIHTYGLFVAMGFTAGLLVTVKIGKDQGVSPQQVMDMAFIIILGAIIGSRLAFVLMNFSSYKAYPLDILKIWEGGLVFSGGLVAVLICMVWYLRRNALSYWAAGDLWAPGLAIGQGIGRIGCLMAGCCYGRPAEVPWHVTFTSPDALAPLNIPLHPTQVYAALSGLVIFLVLMFLRKRKKFEGQIFVWFLILHSTGRLLIERFRGDDRGLIPGAGMTTTQLIALLVLMSAVAALMMLKSRHEKGNVKS
ncbi:MAG: prolipoprotein diacylglyceryl transferase [Pseudomonadota bacterium]